MSNGGLHDALQELSQTLGNPALEPEGDDSLEIALIKEATRRLRKERLTPWPQVRAISTLPGVRLTPVVVLARTLEKAQHGKLHDVYIGMHWADRDEFDYDYSQMSVRDLALHHLTLDNRLRNVAFGSGKDNETLSPAS